MFHVHWFSEILGKATTAQILYPDAGKPPFPTLYLLHGLSDDSTIWLRRTRLEVYAANLPLLIVMPDGYRSFYTNHHEGADYARHFGEELPAFIERTFQVRPTRDARAIGGLSMGGYGALRVGLGYAGRFCSIHSHSGAVGWGQNRNYEQVARATGRGSDFAAELRRIFGPSPEGSDHHLLTLAKRAKKARQLPKISLDCGREDFLLTNNRAFVKELRAAKVPHTYKEHPGSHEWGYWDTHIREALAFHMKNLKLRTGRK